MKQQFPAAKHREKELYMALLSMKDVSIGFGGPLLLDHVDLQIERGERAALLGRNGSGKTTLLRLLNGDISPDDGAISRQQGVHTALLTQEIPQQLTGMVYDAVAAGPGKIRPLLCRFHEVRSQLAGKEDKELLAESSRLHKALDSENGWPLQRQIENIIIRLKLEPDADCAALSAGLKRRVLLARALAANPDILLLDEPTNHMDIDVISLLEELLAEYTGAFIIVTHDRLLVQKTTTRIIELDRARLSAWNCDYKTFLERKTASLDAEVQQWEKFDKKLAKEEAWVRQGIKARRKRNEGRVAKLLLMRETRRQRRVQLGAVRMQTQDAALSGKLVIEAKALSFSYDERPLIENFSCAIMRGDRVGVIGANGSGKTTLLRLLLSELTPRAGSVRQGVNLQIAYFDQLRAQLDEELTVQENAAGGNNFVTINGKQRHIIGYLHDFLFTPERSRTQVKYISGGERNRLLLARLFTQPANLLVMDEPTNDLDIETLELLEELLLDYTGTLLLVSHDRAFLNNVVTSNLVLQGGGVVGEYIGGYDDYLHQQKTAGNGQKEKSPAKPGKPRKTADRARKLSYKEERELAALPQLIEDMENEQQRLFKEMSRPEFFKQEGGAIARAKERLSFLEKELAAAYQRWQILEEIKTTSA